MNLILLFYLSTTIYYIFLLNWELQKIMILMYFLLFIIGIITLPLSFIKLLDKKLHLRSIAKFLLLFSLFNFITIYIIPQFTTSVNIVGFIGEYFIVYLFLGIYILILTVLAKKFSQVLRQYKVLIFLLLPACLILLLFINNYLVTQRNTYGLEKQKILVEIENSGSTNSPGWLVTLNQNGGGSIRFTPSHWNKQNLFYKDTTFPPQTFNIDALRNSLISLSTMENVANGHAVCLKSLSFGTSTSIIFLGKRSGDIECLYQYEPPTHAEVVKHVQQIKSQLFEQL